MRKVASVLMLVMSLILVNCSSDSSSSNNDDEIYVRFTANGVSYDLEPATVTSLQRLVVGEQDVNGVYNRISLWMPLIPNVGSNPITDEFPSSTNLTTLYNADFWIGDNTIEGESGTMVITELTDDYVGGTFSFTGENGGVMLTVTNGTFRAFR